MGFGMIGILLGLVQAPPAIDPRCVLEAISPADRTLIVRAAERGESSDGPARERFERAADQCRERLAWDPLQAGTTAGLALSLIFRDGAAAMLMQSGVSAPAIDRWFVRQAPSFRTNPAVSDQDGQRMVLELQRDGVPREGIEANGRLIGVYLGALIVIERVDRGLPLD